jgi:large subunit ribosomal protein L17
MRHGRKVNHLGRKSNHRKALMANMACSLILHKRISTTVAKAKALRTYVEPLLTKSKEDSTASRRLVFSYLNNKDVVSTLFRDVASKIADRPGGYTRILKTGNRLGDNADMCYIELVDFNEAMLAGKSPKKAKSTTRRGRSGKKATAKAEGAEGTEAAAENTEAPAKPKKTTKKKADPGDSAEEAKSE